MKKKILWISILFFVALGVTLQFTPPEIVYKYFVAPRAQAADITDLTGTTGLIGKEDINWGTGESTDTYTVSTYTGGTVTLTKLPNLLANAYSIIKGQWHVNVAATIADHGAASGADYTAGNLKKIIDTIGVTDVRAIEMPPGTYTIGTNLTPGSNIYLRMPPGAVFSVSTAKTLTIQSPGHIIAQPTQQVFSGAGAVAWSSGGNIQVSWFASPDKAFATLVSNSTISFTPNASYTTAAKCEITVDNVKVYGNKAQLTLANDIDGIDINPSATADGANTLSWIDVYDLYIYTADASPTKAGIKARDVQHLRIERCKLWGHTYGIDIAIRDRTVIENNWFYNCTYGLYHPHYFTAVPITDALIPISGFFLNNTFSKGTNSVCAIYITSAFYNFEITGGSIAGAFDYGVFLASGSAVDNSTGLTIRRLHFEQAVAGDYLIYVDDTSTKRLRTVTIAENEFGGGDATALYLNKVGDAYIVNNHFGQGAGGLPIYCDDDCDKVYDVGNRYASETIQALNNWNNATNVYSLSQGGTEEWRSAGSVLGYYRPVEKDSSDHSTSGTGEDALASTQFSAGLLRATGGLHVFAAGTVTDAAGGNKTIKLHFATANWTVLPAANDNNEWWVEAWITNLSATSQRVQWRAQRSGSTPTMGYETAAIDTANTQTVKLTGECANGADLITQTMWSVTMN